MAKPKHYVLYVPGIMDDAFYIQSILIQCWRLLGVRPVMFVMPWQGDGEFAAKLARLVALVDGHHKNGSNVSLIGASAGASAVLNTYSQRKHEIESVAYICGKINRPDTVSDRIYNQNPAFKDSLYSLQDNVKLLMDKDRQKLTSFYSPADTTVPHSDTIIEGVTEKKLPAVAHGWAIMYALSIGSRKLIQSLKK